VMRHLTMIIASIALPLAWATLLPPTDVSAGEPDEAYTKALGSTLYITSIDRDWNISHGTGVVVNARLGYIATAYHVIGEHNRVCAVLPAFDKDGSLITNTGTYSQCNDASMCVVVAADPKRDLAIIRFKTPRQGLRAMPLAAHHARPGQSVFIIGNDPEQSLWHFASGSVRQVHNSAYRFENGQQISTRVMETSTSINPGDSGGPLFNASGELLGINSATVTTANQVHYGIDVAEVRAFLIETMEAQQRAVTKRTTAIEIHDVDGK
jgi:S1-C subfamily serine protease